MYLEGPDMCTSKLLLPARPAVRAFLNWSRATIWNTRGSPATLCAISLAVGSSVHSCEKAGAGATMH